MTDIIDLEPLHVVLARRLKRAEEEYPAFAKQARAKALPLIVKSSQHLGVALQLGLPRVPEPFLIGLDVAPPQAEIDILLVHGGQPKIVGCFRMSALAVTLCDVNHPHYPKTHSKAYITIPEEHDNRHEKALKDGSLDFLKGGPR
ncbi:MAG: hypothetical protein WAO98_11050 [Alphaproteobacteria bacterium]